MPHPVDVGSGIDKIAEGLKELEEGRVSATKLVIRIGEL
jgi:hypothetical protein